MNIIPKISGVTTIVVGTVCAVVAPVQWITGFAVGTILGCSSGCGDYRTIADKPPYVVSKITPDEAREALNQSHPGLITVSLNILACSILVSNVAFPVIFWYTVAPLLIVTAGAVTGLVFGRYPWYLNLKDYDSRIDQGIQ